MDFLLRPAGEESVVILHPSPDFVIKSKLLTVEGRPGNLLKLQPDAKIFINVCHDENVPKPDVDFSSSVVYPLIMNNQWEIPIITSSVREDSDKKGALCYVWDCCINTKCMEWISEDLQLREILVEWCLESCEFSDVVTISRDSIAFPRMKKKGEAIPSLEVHSKELSNDYKKEIASFMEDGGNSPSEILKMKRDLLNEESSSFLEKTDDEELPPLIPVGRQSTSNKPLIEEIDSLSIADLKRSLSSANQELPEVQFEVRMRKTKNTNRFKMRIEISSQIDSGPDLKLRYNIKENSLEIRNVNLSAYKEKVLQIPLPNIFAQEETLRMQSFFIGKEKKLVLFI